MAYVVEELRAAYQDSSPPDAASSANGRDIASEAIETAFEKLDRDVLEAGRATIEASLPTAEIFSRLALAYSGSCAVLGIFDVRSHVLRVACVGDSRAVLGRRTKGDAYETIALSEDQNCHNWSEVSRLLREHPDEPNMIQEDRVVGMAITRGFGDARWKYTRDELQRLKKEFFGHRPDEDLLTPPYLTAKPVVTTTEIQAGDFMIIASDGLWYDMPSEEAVMLVGEWLKGRQEGEQKSTSKVEPNTERTDVMDGKGEPAGKIDQVPSEDIPVLDDNAATHLARYALGGTDEQMVTANLTLRPPVSRDVR